jgi:uncharacterized membrane protein YvlD (DUF360 family)
MDNTYDIWFMMLISFVIGYVTMPIINTENTTINLNKIYNALLMAFIMGIIEILMHSVHIDYTMLIALLFLTTVLFYFIRNQVFINDTQFYLSMIEHHQMALEMAKSIKQKTTDPDLQNLADNILKTQKEEIDFMRNKLT